ncbi:MAG: MtrB/PioB family outer membrane beta-barrel protein, partial [Betaproteobacteria bacterium]|nr:MtrB/PioB family outer membrane beta-barrel protein [Betaproteobacteria bacterium]
MSIRPSLKTLACCIGAALVQMAAGTVLADSGVGVDTVLGNALNPSQDASRPLDPNGMGPFRQPAAHTPTGQLYNLPYALPEEVKKTETGWEYSGEVEFGVLGGDANSNSEQFRQYKDLDNGPYLNNFGLQMHKPDEARFVEIIGGGVGRRDQYYGLQFGRYNDWKVKTFYSETPHVFTSTYNSIWNGVGTGNLTLVPGLTPGGTAVMATDNANVRAAILNAGNSTLIVTRKKGGVRYDMNLSNSWKGYASYTLEQREGARPFGAVWGGGGGTAPTEIAEPVDNKTHDVLAGLQYADALNAFNLRLSASLFRNNNDTLIFQEPYRLFAAVTNGIAPGGFTQGRFDLHPNNEAYNAKAEFARSLPDFHKGRFTAVVSLGTNRQNDNLIPYTTIPGVTLANVTGNNWDTTNSLSRTSAEARIDTSLVDLGLAVNPTDALNLKGKLRYYQTDNKINPFLACNRNAAYVDNDPNTAGAQAGGLTKDGCTGVWGRLINDGTGSSVLMGASSARAGNLPIISVPFAYKQYNMGLSGDYRLNKVSSVNAGYEREIFQREHRER